MWVQIFVFSVLILYYFVYQGKSDNKSRKNYIVICSLILLLKAALRSVTVGRDTSHYAGFFYESKNTPWSELWSAFFNRYQNVSGYEDVGYGVIQKVFSTFIPDFNLFTFCIQGLLFYWPLGVLIFRYSKDTLQILFAYVLMNALFMGLPMANARQVYAIGMCIWAFLYLSKKQYWKVVLFVLLGYFIHASALLFLFPVALSFFNERSLKSLSIAVFALSFVVFTMPNTIILFMANMIESEKYAGYAMDEVQGGALTYITLSLLLCFFCTVAFLTDKHISNEKKNWYVMIPLTSFFTPLIYSNGSMIRITMYFQIFFLLLVPYAIDELFHSKYRKTCYFTLLSILIILAVLTAVDYRFCWEENQDPWINWT